MTRALHSVLKQTYQDLEVLVVDDGSTIDLSGIIDQIGDSRIRLIRNEPKTNANVVRNIGIKQAKGAYIAMLDSDDEWLPHHLERKLAYLKSQQAHGVFGSVKIHRVDKEEVKISRPFTRNEKMVNYLLDGGFAPTPTHFYQKEAIQKTLFDEALHRHQDWDLSVRFSAQYKFVPDAEVTAIVHWESTSKTKKTNYDSEISYIKKYKTSIFPHLYAKYHVKMYLKTKKGRST